MRWTPQQYEEYQARREAQSSKPEPAFFDEPVAEAEREESNATRVLVCVVSYRRRLIDPDNICPKYFIDCLRYAGIIPNDRAEDIITDVRQIKVGKGEEERTELTVTPSSCRF